MDGLQIPVEVILAVIAIASFVYTWMNERRRRIAEASLVKLKAMEATITGICEDKPVIHLTMANRQFMPVLISSLGFKALNSRISGFVPVPEPNAPFRYQIPLGVFQATWTYWEKEKLVLDLVQHMLTSDNKWNPLRKRVYIAKNVITLKLRKQIKVRFHVGTSILENYESNTLKIGTKPFRKEINGSIRNRKTIKPIG